MATVIRIRSSAEHAVDIFCAKLLGMVQNKVKEIFWEEAGSEIKYLDTGDDGRGG